MFFDVQRLELVRRVAMAASVSALLWHERLNQIFVGTGAELLLSLEQACLLKSREEPR